MSETSLGLELFQQSHERLLQQFLELERQKLPADVIDKQLMDIAEGIVRDYNTSALIAGRTRLSDEDEREFRSQARGIMGGGALVPLLEREDVENIHILGHDKVILSLANGDRIAAPPLAGSEEELVMMIRHLAATAGHTSRRFDTAAPILDLRLASGHRLFAVTAVAERTSVVIRRHRMLQSALEKLEGYGTVTPAMTAVLRAAVKPPNPANMLVVGGTGAGKTTLLRALLSEVPQSELVVTIEDTLELHLRSSGLHERTLALETARRAHRGTGPQLCRRHERDGTGSRAGPPGRQPHPGSALQLRHRCVVQLASHQARLLPAGGCRGLVHDQVERQPALAAAAMAGTSQHSIDGYVRSQRRRLPPKAPFSSPPL